MTRAYASQIIWGPHFYAQSVIPFKIDESYMRASGRAGVVVQMMIMATKERGGEARAI